MMYFWHFFREELTHGYSLIKILSIKFDNFSGFLVAYILFYREISVYYFLVDNLLLQKYQTWSHCRHRIFRRSPGGTVRPRTVQTPKAIKAAGKRIRPKSAFQAENHLPRIIVQ